MMRRSLARGLAIAALLAAAVAVALIVSGSGGSGLERDDDGHDPPGAPPAPPRGAPPRKSHARFYVVKAGDTLSKISLRTHVSIAVLQELNPKLDPAALQTGQKIKLSS